VPGWKETTRKKEDERERERILKGDNVLLAVSQKRVDGG
jgi:hypothetical protein